MPNSDDAPQQRARDSKPSADNEPDGGRRWGSWVRGWVLVPGVLAAFVFGGGVMVGAHFHDSWFARSVLWLAERM